MSLNAGQSTKASTYGTTSLIVPFTLRLLSDSRHMPMSAANMEKRNAQ